VEFVLSEVGVEEGLAVDASCLFVLVVDFEVSEFFDIDVEVNGRFFLFAGFVVGFAGELAAVVEELVDGGAFGEGAVALGLFAEEGLVEYL
jgi:hypothetical protein